MRKAGEVCYGAAHGDVGKNKGVVCYDRKEVSSNANQMVAAITFTKMRLKLLILTEIKDAERAVDELDGRDINGRAVTLKFVVRDDWETGSGKFLIL